MTDRCPTCDRPECDRATVPAVGGPAPACAGQAVDWRTRALAAERELSAERRSPPAPLREALAKYEASVAAWAKGTPGSRLDEAVAMEFHRAAVVSALATAEAAAEQRGMSAAQGKGTDDE